MNEKLLQEAHGWICRLYTTNPLESQSAWQVVNAGGEAHRIACRRSSGNRLELCQGCESSETCKGPLPIRVSVRLLERQPRGMNALTGYDRKRLITGPGRGKTKKEKTHAERSWQRFVNRMENKYGRKIGTLRKIAREEDGRG